MRNFVVEVRHDAKTDPHLLVGLSVVRAHLAPPTCKHVSSYLYGAKASHLEEALQSDLCCITMMDTLPFIESQYSQSRRRTVLHTALFITLKGRSELKSTFIYSNHADRQCNTRSFLP